MKRIGQMKGVSKHGNEHSTFSAHFSTMGRIKLHEIKLSLHLSIVGQKKKCRVFSYPTHSLSWFPRFWSKTNMWYGGHIRCWIWTKRGMLFLKTTYHSCKVSVSNKKAKPICLMVFNNIYVISWWSVLFVEETGGPGEIRIITKLPNSE
jgi:hypothetical protein